MTDVWGAVGSIAGAIGGLTGLVALGVSIKANRTANTTAKRSLAIEQGVEHERLKPQLQFAFREVVGGGGLACTLTVDRDVDSLTLELVRDVDQAADNIIGLTEGFAPGPAGTLSAKLAVGGIAAGAGMPLTLWTSDLDRAAGASVRIRTEARRGDRVWSNLLNDLSIPLDVGSKTAS